MIVGLVIAALVTVLAIAAVVSYNRFVSQRNLVQESWKQVDVELQRRFDLIPNLVESVKGYVKHEQSTLQALVAARTAAQAAADASPSDRQAPENALGGAVRGLLAVAEAYPDLKANQNFLVVQQELANTEDRIAAGRRFYNANVRALSTRIESFPSNLIAGVFKFAKADYFEIEDPAARHPVRVQF